MAEPTTVNIALVIPNTGDLVGTWGSNAINPDLSAIDGLFGGVQPISASNANIVLTAPAGSITPSAGPTQSQNAVLRFTGALTGSVQVTLPLPGYMIIENLTTGNFVLSFRAVASGQVIGIEQGVVQQIYNDGTNVRFVNLQTVGSYLDVCDATIPAWVAACTVPPYLNCDGTTFNATTYPYLNAKLGGNTLPDFRGVSPAYLNQGTGRITTAGSGLNGDVRFSNGGGQTQTLTAAQIPSITSSGSNSITVTAAGLFIPTSTAPWVLSGASTGGNQVAVSNNGTISFASSFSGSNTINVTSNNTSSAAHPIVQPTTIAGLRLIRAA